ncbi:anaphase-promoting complex subunit 4 isoform X2 [Ceratina calcarata]|uniref:Anaphase-promoting complex subunit 4 n=1 Tax=Ceratina calcarata TaxID=156304 RepID=A0AAJ7SBK1_9HYME|nr:anaphase-promoting complex subunit 4 isoform X2 [Ceratina calcarata]XP_026674854.1 anaphase-promoting complex subunit 4 isoform X2 [Ceratina calcarata]
MVPEDGSPSRCKCERFFTYNFLDTIFDQLYFLCEVTLHRLTWQRVWLLSPQEEPDTVANLAWRPDGKLLAICYETSKSMCLVDIENKNIVHKTKLTSYDSISCTAWLPISNTDDGNSPNGNKPSMLPTGEYLPPLPSLNRSFGQESECKEFLSQNLDILFLGLDDGRVAMYVFGMFYCGIISVGNGRVVEISGGSDKSMWTTCRDDSGIKVGRLCCPLLEQSTAFLKVAQAQANIEYLMDYLSRTLMAISEAWETILLEMDEKLARYAETNPPGGMAADFLELLMIGIPSQNLEKFLLHDLTEKGLKKLGHSIEMCYSNIQKLVLKNLTSVGMALVYQLAEMRGMVRFGGPYELLGLTDETVITNGLHATEAFLAKSSEIQQVIDHSMRDYKVFFRWLYVVILRLTDERIPSEASRISQQELTFIAEFLRGFDKTESGVGARKGVNLEKLGQYLRRESLQTCLTPEGSEWATVLDENRCLHDHPLIIKQDLNYSLLQSHEKLVTAVHDVFREAYQGLVGHFALSSIGLAPSTGFESSQIATNDDALLVATCDVDRKLLRIFKVECTCAEPVSLSFVSGTVEVDQRSETHSKGYVDCTVVDLQFYSNEYLSLLLLNKHTHATYLVQMPLDHARIFENRDKNAVSLADLLGNGWPRPFQGMSAGRIAVSGARKVAAVLSESNRKIRLLETEVEPEDDEDEEEEEDGSNDILNTTRGTSASAH